MDFHSNLAMFTIVEAVIGELVKVVKDETIVKQQNESTPGDPVYRYEVWQNLDKIGKDFRHSGLSF
jgi:hypothetical protein